MLALVWSTRPSSAIPGGLAVWGGWVAGVAAAGGLARHLVGLEHAGGRGPVRRRHAGRAAGADGRRHRRPGAGAALAYHSDPRARVRPQLDPLRAAGGGHRSGAARAGDRSGARGLGGHGAGRRELAGCRCIEDLRADEVAGGFVAVPRAVPPVLLEVEVFRAARAALIEVARNSVRHGGATSIVVEVRQPDPGIIVHRCHRQRQRAVPDVASRYRHDDGARRVTGRDRWLVEPFADATRGSSVAISIPCVRPGVRTRRPRAGLPSVRQGAPARDGSRSPAQRRWVALYFAACFPSAAWGRCSPSSPALVGALAALAIVVRRRRLSSRLSVLLVLAPALVPWLLLGQTVACGEATAASRAVNIAGLLDASHHRVGQTGHRTRRTADLGRRHSAARLRDPVRLPRILPRRVAQRRSPRYPSSSSSRPRGRGRIGAAQDRTQVARQREIVESSRAAAAMDVNTGLQDAVQEALAILGDRGRRCALG